MNPLEICAVAVILVCTVLVVYFLVLVKPVSFRKKNGGEGTSVSIKANEDIRMIELKVEVDGEMLDFKRSGVKKNEEIVFTYPPTQNKAELTVYLAGKKKAKVYEV